MTADERRRCPEHHVVHDYANLVSAGVLITTPQFNQDLEMCHWANGHVWHMFYVNCRKLFEFFAYKAKPRDKYLRAQQFMARRVPFPFSHWNRGVQDFMGAHMLHVGAGRVDNTIIMDGHDDRLYLADFQEAWGLLMGNLKTEHKDVFREEIDYRLTNPAFAICGSLGKELIV
jgi:hypothetical protein